MTTPVRARGTSNTNDRGNTKTRAARRAWLLSTYAADVALVLVTGLDGDWLALPPMPFRDGDPTLLPPVSAARCYRCGKLLHDTVDLPLLGIHVPATLTVDRIVPHRPRRHLPPHQHSARLCRMQLDHRWRPRRR